jgi:hypothetical protein
VVSYLCILINIDLYILFFISDYINKRGFYPFSTITNNKAQVEEYEIIDVPSKNEQQEPEIPEEEPEEEEESEESEEKDDDFLF